MTATALKLVPKEPAREFTSAQALTAEQEAAQAAELKRATEAMHRSNEARARLFKEQAEYTRQGQEAVSQLSLVIANNGTKSNEPTLTGDDHNFIKKAYFIAVSNQDPKTVVVMDRPLSGSDKSVLNLKGSFSKTCATEAEAWKLVEALTIYRSQQRNYGVYIPPKP